MDNMSKARFHFEIFWPKFEEYGQIVSDTWQRLAGSAGAIRHLDNNLRGLVKELQRWSATRIGGIKEQLLMARELIQWLDEAQESRQLTEGEAGLRKRMKLRCLGPSSLDRTIDRQRSRIR
jgi:hypothetical protein